MAKKQPFTLVYADDVKDHLGALDAKYHAEMQTEIESQLLHEPDVETRMKSASIADIKAHLSAYLKESEQGPVVVTRNGKAVAVLLAVTDDDELERLVLAHSPKFQALLDKSRRQIEDTGGISHEQFWREVTAEARKPAEKNGRGRRRTSR